MVAIIDADGNAKVQYTYDAWGTILSISGPMADTLGAVNPITYRGYVYDAETDLYYLESRYYDPAVGRFINADALVSTGQGLLGNNMFAYCLNNPVNGVDPTGALAWWIIIPLIITTIPLLGGCEDDSEDDSNEYGSAWEYEYSGSTNYNCYAHALGIDEWKYVGGSRNAVKDYSLDNVASMVEDDIKKMGWSIRPIDSYDSPIEEDEFRIALATGPNDYHFMVQHSDGTWSHKPGYLPTMSLGDKNPSQVSWDLYGSLKLSNGKMVVFVVEENYYCNGPIYYAVSKGG